MIARAVRGVMCVVPGRCLWRGHALPGTLVCTKTLCCLMAPMYARAPHPGLTCHPRPAPRPPSPHCESRRVFAELCAGVTWGMRGSHPPDLCARHLLALHITPMKGRGHDNRSHDYACALVRCHDGFDRPPLCWHGGWVLCDVAVQSVPVTHHVAGHWELQAPVHVLSASSQSPLDPGASAKWSVCPSASPLGP